MNQRFLRLGPADFEEGAGGLSGLRYCRPWVVPALGGALGGDGSAIVAVFRVFSGCVVSESG